MKSLLKDIFICFLFIAGLYGFLAGEFIISSVLFAVAAIASYVLLAREKDGLHQPVLSKQSAEQ